MKHADGGFLSVIEMSVKTLIERCGLFDGKNNNQIH